MDPEEDWGNLEPSKHRKKNDNEAWVIYIAFDDHIILLPKNQSIGYGFDSAPEWVEWLSPCICDKCGTINVLGGEMEITLVEDRNMGPDIFWSRNEEFYCSNCNNEISVEGDVSCYAAGWIEDFGITGGKFTRIRTLDDVVKDYFRNTYRMRVYKNQIQMLEEYVDDVLGYVEKSGGYVLLIEGDDDLEVWKQILKKEDLNYRRVSIVKYGKGGLDEAIKACSLLEKPVLKDIPKKLLLDSDNNKDEIEKKLKTSGIKKENYHILEKKEIDCYLIDSKAISIISGLDESYVEHLIEEHSVTSKGGLEKLFIKEIGIKATPEIKGLIARNLPDTPEEFKTICLEIASSLDERDTLLELRYEEA